MALINFLGEVVAFERTTFNYPTPDEVMAFGRAAIAKILRKNKAIASSRIAGLGIASPFHLWNWGEEVGAPPGSLAAWKQIDIRAELERDYDWPVYLFNDAMVSAAAELMFGSGAGRADFLYAYIGYFIGGGLVLDHHLFPGRSKRAGSLGDMPVPAPKGSNADSVPLLQTASLFTLAKKLNGHATDIWASPDEWGDLGRPLIDWIDEVSNGLAFAIKSAVALIDVDNVVIDGAIPAAVRKDIARQTRLKLAQLLADRPEPFSVLEGTYGHMGPAIGGATIPLLVNYSNDKDVLFKD